MAQQTSELANTPLTYVFWGISALTLLTFGCVNAGCTYLLRNLVMGEPVFVWSDFWYAVKRNWKQALPLGILDAALLFLIPYNIYAMLASSNNYFTSVLLWMNIILFVLYTFMRFYLYLQLVIFDMKLTKIIKNAFIFALLGWKRNIMATLGILLMIALEVLLLMSGTGLLLPLAVAMPLMIFFSHASSRGKPAALRGSVLTEYTSISCQNSFSVFFAIMTLPGNESLLIILSYTERSSQERKSIKTACTAF